MKKRILLITIGLLLTLTLVGCGFEGDPMIDDMWTRNIYPGTDGTYDIGSAIYKFDDIWAATGHFDAESLYIGDTALTEALLITILNPPGGGGGGDMLKAVYDPDLDGYIAEAELALNYPTHASGDGLIIKSGSVITNGSGVATITFTTNFPTTNYSIILTAMDGGDTTIAMYDSKSVSGFNIKTEDDRGANESSVTVDWAAIEYNND